MVKHCVPRVGILLLKFGLNEFSECTYNIVVNYFNCFNGLLIVSDFSSQQYTNESIDQCFIGDCLSVPLPPFSCFCEICSTVKTSTLSKRKKRKERRQLFRLIQ